MQIKIKKKRKVNHPIVDIENICTEAGENYINWVLACRNKLKEREIKIIEIRLQLYNEIIISSLQQFINETRKAIDKHKEFVHIDVDRMELENYGAYNKTLHRKYSIVNNFNNSITRKLCIWNGCKTTNPIHTFAQYFKKARGYWDIQKMSIIAEHFVVEIYRIVNEVIIQ